MTNRAARTEHLVMEVLMTMLLKGYFWVVFSFSLTSTPWCLHQRVHFASYYLPLFLHNLECSCSGGQIKVWWNQMRMKRIMKEKWRRRAGSAEGKVLNQRASAQQDCGLYRPVVRPRCGGCRMKAGVRHLITHLKKKKKNKMESPCKIHACAVGFRKHVKVCSRVSGGAGLDELFQEKWRKRNEVRILQRGCWRSRVSRAGTWRDGRFYGNCFSAPHCRQARLWV